MIQGVLNGLLVYVACLTAGLLFFALPAAMTNNETKWSYVLEGAFGVGTALFTLIIIAAW